MLSIYPRQTSGLARRSSALFVSPSCPTRAISKNTLPFFLRYVISGSGAVSGAAGSSVPAHSIRGVSTSVFLLQYWSVSKVLEAATWRSNSVFASSHLKDLASVFEGLRSLGPFVAAGSVVSPP